MQWMRALTRSRPTRILSSHAKAEKHENILDGQPLSTHLGTIMTDFLHALHEADIIRLIPSVMMDAFSVCARSLRIGWCMMHFGVAGDWAGRIASAVKEGFDGSLTSLRNVTSGTGQAAFKNIRTTAIYVRRNGRTGDGALVACKKEGHPPI